MGATAYHELTATTPDDPAAEIQPKHWNSAHIIMVALVSAAEISGAFSNANGISFGDSAGKLTASYTVPTQSVQTQASGNIAGAGFTSTTTAGVDVKGTHNSAGLSLGVPAYITTYAAQTVQTQASGNIPRSGFTTTTIAGSVVAGTHNTDGLLLAVPAYLTAAAGGGDGFNRLAAGTQTAGTNTTVVFADSNGITFGMSGSTQITASHNGLTTARASNDAVGLNTAQTNVTWTVNSAGLSFNAAGYAGTGTSATNASITLNSNGLAISVAAPGAGGGAAISGGTNSQNTGTVNFSNSNGVSFGLNTNGVMTASVALNATASEMEPIFGSSLLSNLTLGQNTLYFVGFDVPQDLSAYRVNFFHSIATVLQASNSTNSAGLTFSAALYSRGTGASTERIGTFWSGSWFIRMSNSSNTQVRVTHPIGISNSTAVSTTSNGVISSSNASTYLLNSVGGYRMVPMPISSMLTPGRYWMAVAQSTASSNAIGVIQQSVLQQTNGANIAYRPFGTSSAASNASVFPTWPGDGTYSATSGAFPATIALSVSDIRGSPVITIPYFNFSGYTTGTNLL